MAETTQPLVGNVPGSNEQPAVQRTPVMSSHLASVGYDEQTGRLAVEFRDGEIYEYANVPQETYIELITSKSVGKFFNQAIRSQFKGVQTD
jgi:hypothetical protein